MRLKWITSAFLWVLAFYFLDIRPALYELNLSRSKQQQLQHAIAVHTKKHQKTKSHQTIKLNQAEMAKILTKILFANGFSISSMQLVKDVSKNELQIMTFNLLVRGSDYTEIERVMSQLEMQGYVIVLESLRIFVVHDEIEIQMRISFFGTKDFSKKTLGFKLIGNMRTNKENIAILKNDVGELKIMSEAT